MRSKSRMSQSKIFVEVIIMKNEKKFFDGDMIYTVSVTFLAGMLAVGTLLANVIWSAQLLTLAKNFPVGRRGNFLYVGRHGVARIFVRPDEFGKGTRPNNLVNNHKIIGDLISLLLLGVSVNHRIKLREVFGDGLAEKARVKIFRQENVDGLTVQFQIRDGNAPSINLVADNQSFVVEGVAVVNQNVARIPNDRRQ